MTTIRLSVNTKLDKVLNDLRKNKFPLLENSEIIKTVLSEYYTAFSNQQKNQSIQDLINSKPQYLVDTETEKRIAKAEKEYASNQEIIVDMSDEKQTKALFGV